VKLINLLIPPLTGEDAVPAPVFGKAGLWALPELFLSDIVLSFCIRMAREHITVVFIKIQEDFL